MFERQCGHNLKIQLLQAPLGAVTKGKWGFRTLLLFLGTALNFLTATNVPVSSPATKGPVYILKVTLENGPCRSETPASKP